MHIDFAFVSRFRYVHTMMWAILMSALIISLAAVVGRATVNLRGALTADDGSLAVMMLLPEENISDVTLVKASVDRQEFLVETKDGPKLIRLKKGEEKWFVEEKINLDE